MQATDGASEAREGIVALDFQLSQTANSGDMHRLEQLLIKDPAVVVKAMTKSAGKLNVVHKAAARGHAHVLRRLLEVGGRHDVALPNGDRAIHLAVRAGQPTTLKVLLDRGADYSCKNSAGNSPLYEAVVGRQSHCFLHLVQSGADYHSYIQQGKITEHDIKNLQRGLHGMSAEQQSLLFSTLGHIGAEWEISDSDVRSDADRHREKFMREQEYQVKELEMQQTAQAAAAASLASVSPRTNPMDVCASLIAESKSARSDLRRSLEDRCQSSNIVEQAFMLRNEKAEHDAAEKAKSRAMANGISGAYEMLAREARLDKLEGVDSPSSRLRYTGTVAPRSVRASRTAASGRSSAGSSLLSSPSPRARAGGSSGGSMLGSSSSMGTATAALRKAEVTPIKDFKASRLSIYPPSSASPRPRVAMGGASSSRLNLSVVGSVGSLSR